MIAMCRCGLRFNQGLSLLSRYFRIEKEREAEVMSFVRRYPFLLTILEEAPDQIYYIFGKNISLWLELHHDPEGCWDELFIVVKSSYSAEEAINLENRLFEEWFLGRIKVAQGKLNIIEEPLLVRGGGQKADGSE